MDKQIKCPTPASLPLPLAPLQLKIDNTDSIKKAVLISSLQYHIDNKQMILKITYEKVSHQMRK